ncbi:zinc transporter ZIP1 [Rhinatrema bivittatum]|uniref:zinc transporter ZIP1 n=1 Tax=Rhinatrema bivittatum TaxID=194408 RepID=UPI001129655D|nr:zinc transporter ZIP1 [Rhinatrema bivittatum]XP_029437085.1 zinc transporter ZIP1 [Rhinatrema bivittatum]XP_029437086.1 zinc transporter ZIP1 [Rhinatrema bivittatum]XP_029437089.1 zinc transporter ZIP1 [Rhinatrema bivittatum]
MGNSGRMVWSPNFHSIPRSSVGLEVKLGSMVTLLLLTVVCGLVPLFVLRCQRNAGSTDTRRKILSLVSCFAGGVFLATCLLDLLPDYLSGISEALETLHITLQFPLQEFIIAMGFFIVLVMEQIVLAYKDQSGSLQETRTLLGTSVSNQIQTRHWHDGPAPLPHQHGEERVHIHIDFNSHSIIRSFILVFSLSLHSVFEGLAVGLQETSSKVLEISLALLIHKCIIACSLALKLVQSQLRQTVVVTCILLFAVMSPLGIGLGVALTESSNAVHQLTRSVLEGIATGTFIYITFLEILPHELSSSQQRILKVLLLITGFSVVSGVLFIKI